MTRDSVKAQLSVDLGDPDYTFFSADDYAAAIQDAYDEISVFCGQINNTATLSFTTDSSYNFLLLIPDYFAVTSIFNKNTNRQLTPSSRSEMDALRNNWETMSGEPTWFFPNGPERVVIVPHHSTATGEMVVHYRATAPTLSGSTIIKISREHEVLLKDYVKMDLLEQSREFAKALSHFQGYTIRLRKYSNSVKKFGYPDKRVSL